MYRKIDFLDKLILEKIQKDAKITHKELAAELNVSTKPIFDRIKRFEKNGIIKKYVGILDEKKLNKKITAFCSISLHSLFENDISIFIKEIKQIPDIVEIFQTAGNFDYLVKVIVKDMDEFQSFVSKKLFKVKNINSVKTSFVTKEEKRTTEIRDISEYIVEPISKSTSF